MPYETTIHCDAVDADLDLLSLDLTVTEICDCGHGKAEHSEGQCAACAHAQNPSPDGACRAGGFTNGEVRLAILLGEMSFDSMAEAAVA